jgi:hypothetical protein
MGNSENMKPKTVLVQLALTGSLVVAGGHHLAAQNMQSHHSTTSGPHAFSIQSFGAFRNLMMQGDFSSKVALADIMAMQPTTGVGAVSDARGEITILDGKLIVTYGKENMPASKDEGAALLATGTVDTWQMIPVETNIEPAKVEAYLAGIAKAHGIDPDKSFPFQLTGTLAPYVMHINASQSGGPYGMGRPMAITVERKGDEIPGRVAGFYVSSVLMGVVTHGGERTHSHWVAMDDHETAHLDLWGIKAGSQLMLPKPE